MTRHLLIVCPQAVGPAWIKTLDQWVCGSVRLWSHQHAAGVWAAERHASMLAMDMGTGKSLTALFAAGAAEQMTPLLLVDGQTKRRAAVLKQTVAASRGQPLAVIVNYDAIWLKDLAPVVSGIDWSAIILDESHRIKSPGGKASRWLSMLAAAQPNAKRLLLTGTPMPHSPLDLWAQFRFLNSRVFGNSFTRFRARYAECDRMFPSKVRAWKRQPELMRILDEHAWRVSADEVLDLPDAIHETVPVVLSSKTLRFYRELEREMTAGIEAGTVTAANALTKLLRLQQATGGYATLDGGGVVAIDGTPAKRHALEEWLSDLPVSEPIVVFCKFRADLEDVEAAARATGRTYAEVSGSRKDLERWQCGDASIVGVQIQSGGVGIDLTRAAYAAYYSLGFSLGDYEQSLARLRRPGQNRCVRYYHFVATGTVDERVYAALRERSDVVNAVLSGLSKRTEVAA